MSEQDFTRVFTIRNHGGLHARPAKVLVNLAKPFSCAIKGQNVSRDNGRELNLKSLMGVLGLGVKQGNQLRITAHGEDAEQALAAMADGIADGLGEPLPPLPAEEQAEKPEPAQPAATAMTPQLVNGELTAIGASPGIAIGEVFVLRHQAFEYPLTAADSAAERKALQTAIPLAREQLKQLEIDLLHRTGEEQAGIIQVQLELLDDPELLAQSVQRIDGGTSAAHGWADAIEQAAQIQAAMEDPLLAERAADLRDVGRRVLAALLGQPLAAEMPSSPYVLLAEDVGPSEVVGLNTELVLGICTALGGASSHSAILARSLAIPAMVGCGDALLDIADGTPVIVDGKRGQLLVDPPPELLARKRKQLEEQQAKQAADFACRHQPAQTQDGHRVEVMANIGDAESAADAVEQGAEGIGLLRTEFLFMAMSQEPDVATQVMEYKKIVDALDGKPLVARTLDVGGDKPLPYWPVPKEDNPFLGMRGVRLCFDKPEVLERQVRALLTAAGERPVRIMVPMVGLLEEWRQVDQLIKEVQAKIQCPDLQVGMMVEVPAAALMADRFASAVDFFSIGTNDLTQYTLAIDRGHPQLSARADAIHPAVLRLINMTVKAAHAKGKWVGVCGELASDPLAVPILLGLGVDELSVSAKLVPAVKARVRELTLKQSQQMAAQALGCPTAADVRELSDRQR